MTILFRRYLGLAFRLVLAVIFLVASASKVTQPWVFVHTLQNYHMMPDAIARPVGLALPWLELLIGLYLLIGLFTRLTAIATAMTLGVFMVALTTQIARGNTDMSCGCFSGLNNPIINALAGGTTIGAWDVIRDGLLLLMAIVVALTPRPILAVDAWLARRRDEAADDDYQMMPDLA